MGTKTKDTRHPNTAPDQHPDGGERIALERQFDRRYRRWVRVTASGVVLLVFGAEIPWLAGPAAASLALWSGGVMFALFYQAKRYHPRGTGPSLPNTLTTIRVLAGLGMLLFLAAVEMTSTAGTTNGIPEMLGPRSQWLLPAVLLLVETTDFFDGLLARRSRLGPFGGTWDLESDSIFILALALTLRHGFDEAMFVLLIGLMRYLYALLWQHPVPMPRVPPAFKWYAKTTTATLTISMIVVTAPIIGPGLRVAALSLALGMQIGSFAWDISLQITQRRRSLATPSPAEARARTHAT